MEITLKHFWSILFIFYSIKMISPIIFLWILVLKPSEWISTPIVSVTRLFAFYSTSSKILIVMHYPGIYKLNVWSHCTTSQCQSKEDNRLSIPGLHHEYQFKNIFYLIQTTNKSGRFLGFWFWSCFKGTLYLIGQ